MGYSGSNGKPPATPRRLRLHFAAGFAAALLLIVGEAGLPAAPPRAIQPYLPDDQRPALFRSDPYYGVQYESWEAFREDYADGLKPNELLFDMPNPPRTWAMFGSSFVHAPGMLADMAVFARQTVGMVHAGPGGAPPDVGQAFIYFQF